MIGTRLYHSLAVVELRQLLAISGLTVQVGGWGRVLVDHAGVIKRCSDPARWMFLASLGELEGGPIRARISGLDFGEVAAGDKGRSIAALSGDGNWHRFEAVDVFDRRFPVAISISRIHVSRDAPFLLHLRYGLATNG